MTKRFLSLLAALLMLLPACAWADDADNLLVNGDFESIGADGLPTGWFTDAYRTREGVTLYGTTDAAHGGNSAAQVENIGLNDARFAQRVKVEPNTMYCLSGFILAEDVVDSGRGANLSIADVYVFSESVFDSQGEWVYVELYGETGEDQHEVTVFARVGGYSGESIGKASFDDLAMYKVHDLPGNAVAEAWYKREAPPVIDAGADEDVDETPGPAWPWLLALTVPYIGAALWLMRWFQLDRREEALREAAERSGKYRAGMPVFVMIGLLAAFVVRVLIALNVEGYQVDVNCFSAWGSTMASVGPAQFYQTNWCDYVPGYVYVMGFNGLLANALSPYVTTAFVHKLIPMICDLIAAWLTYRLATEHACTCKQAGLLALLVAFNPAIILNSAAWCQIDSVLCVGLMGVAYLAIHRQWKYVLPLYVLCALVKPQALMLGFLGLAAIIMAVVEAKEKAKRLAVLKELGIGIALSLAVALLIVLPFSPNQESASWLFELYGNTLGSYPYATVNTANLYYLFGANWDAIANPADTAACVFFAILSMVWGVYCFLNPSSMKAVVRENSQKIGKALLTWLLTAAVVVPMGFLSSWLDQSFGLIGRIVSGILIVLVSACFGFFVAPKCKWFLDASRRDHMQMIEAALAVFFTTVFVAMAFTGVSWMWLGVAAMAMAFTVVLPIYIRGGKLENLPLCGAVLFMLLYVLGIKMHERYLFPALFLLGMAYAIRRDRRILGLLAATSCVMFLNEGIVLDNSIRLGSSMGHLNNDTVILANLLSLINVASALLAAWVCRRICVEDSEIRLTESIGETRLPVREHEAPPCTPLTFKADSKLHFTRVDALLMFLVTAIYAVTTLTTLGSAKAPQKPWKSTTYDEYAVIDLGRHYDDFSMAYFCQVSYDNFRIATSDDGEIWSEPVWAQMAEGQCFRWMYVTPSYESGSKVNFTSANSFAGVEKMSGRFVKIMPEQIGLILNEVIFKDAQGNVIPATVVGAIDGNPASPLYSDPMHLLDEQDTLEGEPGWWNSTYFDEIYHARTAFEHMNGTVPYETSHPPLGKVIMSWCVAIFGMTPFGWRFAGALCGILMLPAMYLLAKQLTRRTGLAFAAMTMLALDCMHLTQTRIATIDSFPVLFIMLSYFFMLRFMQRDVVREDLKRILPDLALSGFFMGCGFASKWIGAYAGAGLAILFFWTCLRHLRLGMESARMLRSGDAFTQEQIDLLESRDKPAMRRVIILCLWCLLFFVAVPLLIYILSYVPYYAYRTFGSLGEFLAAIWRSQEGMLSYHSTPGLGMDHPFYSPWYEWPLMQRPMYYASPSFVPSGWSYAIFCFGNPAVWFAGLFGVAFAAYRWLSGHRYRITGREGTFQLYSDRWDVAPAFVLIGLLAQFLPWVLVPRGTYIYHYFASIPFLILGVTLLLNSLCRAYPKAGKAVVAAYLAVCLVWFVALFPFASGVLTPTWWLDAVKSLNFLNVWY